MLRPLLPALLLLLGAACASLPEAPPPLRTMEEPLALQKEPDDEPRRRQLAPGSFSGVYVKSAWFEPPDEPGQAPDALEVARLVENSPGVAAGLRPGDLLLSVAIGDEPAEDLAWPGQWRQLETAQPAGTTLRLRYDRAGAERETRLVLAARLQPAAREAAERFREEQRAGIVVRTATEVEARGAGLGPGGGAVLVGMSAHSPWRRAGLEFGDLIVAVDGAPVHHPQMLLGAIRTAAGDAPLRVRYRRGDAAVSTVEVPLTRRERGLDGVDIPLLLTWRTGRGRTEFSLLWGLFGYESTRAAAEYRVLWLISWRTGDRDRLEEVGR